MKTNENVLKKISLKFLARAGLIGNNHFGPLTGRALVAYISTGNVSGLIS